MDADCSAQDQRKTYSSESDSKGHEEKVFGYVGCYESMEDKYKYKYEVRKRKTNQDAPLSYYDTLLAAERERESQKDTVKVDTAATSEEVDYHERRAWYVLDTLGKVKYSVSMLKQWSEKVPYAFKFKVWREDQTEADAIWLKDALDMAFPKDS